MKKSKYLLLTLMISMPGMAEVIGHLDNIFESNGGFSVNGWACDKNQYTSISVHLYVNANEKIISSGKANLSSENAISNLCRTSGVSHRFHIKIPGDNLRKYQGQPITAYGAPLKIT